MSKKATPGIDDLTTVNHKLALEWHPTENGDLKPSMFTEGSHKKVWWLGECGHSWPAPIRDRALKHYGCPYCSNQIVLPGFNDLKTRHPELAEQWDYENNDKLPEDVIAGGNKKYSWRCDLGHTWSATIPTRIRSDGCPYCGNKKLLVGFNDMASTHPKLAQEWDYDLNEKRPEDYIAGSNDYAHWKCEFGHTWRAQINSRKSGKGCPYCANQKVWPGFNDLESKDPKLAAEWDYEKNKKKPSEVTACSGLPFFWKCKFGHSWPATITNRHQGRGCPECDKMNKTSLPEQTLFYYVCRTYPNSVNRYRDIFDNGMELDIYIPSLRIGIEYDGPFHRSEEALRRDAVKYSICRSNDIRLIRVSINENDPDTPICDVFIHSGYDYNNFDALDEVMENLAKHLALDGPFNTKKDLSHIKKGYINTISQNSLAKKNPKICKEWNYEKNDGLTPEMFTSGSGAEVWWKCSLGHEWQAQINSRNRGRKCPYCSNQRVLPGFNDLAYLRPDIAETWDYSKNEGLLPTEVVAKSTKNVWWLCPKGHDSYNMKIVNRAKGEGCKKCRDEMVGVRFSKKVLQYSRDGQLLNTFASATEAARSLGVSASAVSNVCRGKSQSCKGFVFRYG